MKIGTGSTRVATGLLTAVFALSSLSACSGDGEGGGDAKGADWADASAKAKKVLDETSGIELTISTPDDPGVDYLSAATGTIIANPPAFEGTADGNVSSVPVKAVPVISVDGTMYINHPLLGGWSDRFQPKALCAPDPAKLLDPDSGVSNVLIDSTDVTAGEKERGGKDNKETFITYSGTAPGDAIRGILPCSEGDAFEATYQLDGEGRLYSARLTGVFFPESEEVTYTIDVTKYDVTKDIAAPK